MILIGSLKKGGAERNSALLANHLVSQGHQVYLVLFIMDIAFPLDERVNIIQIDHQKYGSKPKNFFYVLFKLRTLCWKIRPRRIIGMSRISSLFAAFLGSFRSIVRFDIYPLVGYAPYKMRQFWIFYNMPFVKYVVCPTEEMKVDVSSYFIRKRKLKVVNNPIPQVSGNYENTVMHDRPYFLVACRLSLSKRVFEVVETFANHSLSKKYDLLVLGDGSEYNKIKEFVESRGLSEKIVLKGFITDPYPYMFHASALINSSTREGFPNVLVETLSLGTPVISSDAKTGPKDIIFPEKNGLLFPVDDFEALSAIFTRIDEEPGLCDSLQANAQLGLDRFSFEKVMKAWEKIL